MQGRCLLGFILWTADSDRFKQGNDMTLVNYFSDGSGCCVENGLHVVRVALKDVLT